MALKDAKEALDDSAFNSNDCPTSSISQLHHKDSNNTSNKQVFNENFMSKNENSMNIFQYLKSKITDNQSNDLIIKGVSCRKVKNGWIPILNEPTVSIFDFSKTNSPKNGIS